MKQILRNLSIAALAFVGAMTVSCINQLEEPQQPQEGNTVTLTTTVGIETSPATKALDADGKKTFAAGEKVALIYTKSDGSTKAISEYAIQSEDIHDSGKKATLSFTLTDPKEGAVTLVYPASLASTAADDGIDPVRLQNTQNGTLTTLSANFDAATASDNMTVSGTSAVLSSSINLTNPLCIGEFTIKEGGDDITNKLLRLTVSDGTNQYVVNRLATAGPVYVAMKPISSDKTVTVSATDGLDYYSKTVTSSAHDMLAANNMYPINVTVTKTDDRATPLTFEAVADAGANVTFTLQDVIISAAGTVEYSKDGTNWYTYTSGNAIPLAKGEKVSFRGSKTKYDGSFFSCTNDCYIYGNVMSLVSPTGFETAQCSNSATFWRLFEYNTKIKNHPSKPLMLPATTLTDNCYGQMFRGCTGLTLPPILPATTLPSGCYQGMFDGCTRLTTAPELPATSLNYRCYASMFEGCSGLVAAPVLSATTMGGSCYAEMFSGCTSLTAAPALPATTLVTDCYNGMFSGCTSLTTAPDLPAKALATSCYAGMFSGCTSLTTAPALPATTLATDCYNGMFSGCTSLTTAPDLPAKALATSCYAGMFSGCTSLTTAPVLEARTLVSACYNKMFQNCSNLNRVTCLAIFGGPLLCTAWLDGVAASGTFIQAVNQSWGSGPSGIPSGWTRMEDISTCTGNFTVDNGRTLTGTLANNVQISIADGATVTLDNLSINAAGTLTDGNHAGITCQGNATITLVGTNAITGFDADYPGIQAGPIGTTLTINGSGSLTASCSTKIINSSDHTGYGAGIGGMKGGTCGNITISGGTITAKSVYGAGIGAGMNGQCGNITISGGNVTVETLYDAGECGASIGSGACINVDGGCGDILISGGTVNVSSGVSGAAIGTGKAVDHTNICGNITISGGTVTATSSSDAAAIGTGCAQRAYSDPTNQCGAITITSGITSVTATIGTSTLDIIGRGRNYDCSDRCIVGTITIDGVANATTASSFEHLNSALSNGDKTWTLTPKTP